MAYFSCQKKNKLLIHNVTLLVYLNNIMDGFACTFKGVIFIFFLV